MDIHFETRAVSSYVVRTLPAEVILTSLSLFATEVEIVLFSQVIV